MKKIILLIIIILLTGCSSVKKDNNEISNSSIEETNDEIEQYIDDNPIKVGLFLYDGTYSFKNVIDSEYYTNFVSGKDIGSFEVFLTDDKTVSGNSFKDIWNKYYNSYDNISNYKVGFNIKFMLKNGENFSSNFTEPDIYRYGKYFYVYLYDDIHVQDGKTYNHLEEMNDDTILTSIKLYAVDAIDEVESIILEVYTYDSMDDFDDNGNYRGNSLYVIRIKNR